MHNIWHTCIVQACCTNNYVDNINFEFKQFLNLICSYCKKWQHKQNCFKSNFQQITIVAGANGPYICENINVSVWPLQWSESNLPAM